MVEEKKEEKSKINRKKFKSPEELQKKIDKYFEDCKKNKEPVTITGLALALDMSSRQDLLNYSTKPGYEDFFDIVKKAKLRVENEIEKAVRKSSRAGDIFILKNLGWSDRQDVSLVLDEKVFLNVNKPFKHGLPKSKR